MHGCALERISERRDMRPLQSIGCRRLRCDRMNQLHRPQGVMAFIITLPSGPVTSPSFMPAGHAPTHFISITLSTVLSALRVSRCIAVLPVSVVMDLERVTLPLKLHSI